MGATNTVNKRMNWLDWMKAIGMYLIVYVHYTSYGYKFLNTFNVPLFFVISGFLAKQESSLRLFTKKNFYNLIVPMLIMTLLVQIRIFISQIINGTFDISYISKVIMGVIIGDQKVLGPCWYIYTLFMLKFLYQLIPNNKRYTLITLTCFCFISIVLSKNGLYAKNSIVNTFISYPFFMFGVLLKKKKEIICRGLNAKSCILVLTLSIIVTLLCSHFNGEVWMYRNDYGKSFLLYLIGGISGTLGIYIICKWLDKINSSIVTTIANGSIIILGLHFYILSYLHICKELDFISAFICLILFIPVIKLCEKKLPMLIGAYRAKQQK